MTSNDADSAAEILAVFAQLVEEFVGVPASKVILEADLINDLDIDSLAMFEILVSAEDRLGVQIPDEQIKSFVTVRDMVNYVTRHSDVHSPRGGESQSR